MSMIKDEIEKLKEIQQTTLEYLDNDENDIADSKKIINYIDDEDISTNIYLLRDFLCMISNISNHHHKTQFFWEKVDFILTHIQNEIKDNFSRSTIFNIFKNNKRILYFLFNSKILIMDKNIYDYMNIKYEYNEWNSMYFIKEFSPFIEQKNFKNLMENYPEISDFNSESFDQKRKIGENNDYICELIRNDSIDEFITYINQNDISINKYRIKFSIFETNLFLTNFYNYSLIEYAAFFGSIKIFKYLFMNDVELNSSLWHFAIHGRNPEVIHLLEENQIKPSDTTYKSCLEESIKCHHNELINYFKGNLYITESEASVYLKNLQCFNFIYLSENEPNDLDFSQILCHFCQNGCCSIISHLIGDSKFNVNTQIVVEKEKTEIFYIMKMNVHKKITASPIHFAVQKKNFELVTILLKRNDLDINMKGQFITKKKSYRFDQRSEELNDEKTPLSIAIGKNDIKIIEQLIQRKDINVNIKLNTKEFKKYEEIINCYASTISRKVREEKKLQRTALHDVIYDQKLDIIKILLKIKNIDLYAKHILISQLLDGWEGNKSLVNTNRSETAIDIANYYGNIQIIDLLNSYNKNNIIKIDICYFYFSFWFAEMR